MDNPGFEADEKRNPESEENNIELKSGVGGLDSQDEVDSLPKKRESAMNSSQRIKDSKRDTTVNLPDLNNDIQPPVSGIMQPPEVEALEKESFQNSRKDGFIPEKKLSSAQNLDMIEDDGSDSDLLNVLISKFGEGSNISKNINNIRENFHLTEYFNRVLPITILIAFLGYIIAVIQIHSEIQDEDFWCRGDGFLYLLAGIVGLSILYFHVIKKYLGSQLYRLLIAPLDRLYSKLWKFWLVKLIFAASVLALVAAFYFIDTTNQRRRLVPLCGLFFVFSMGYIFSYAPGKVVWRFTIWGLSLQFILALLVLRWPLGSKILSCLSGKVSEFLNFSRKGSSFVFGSVAESKPQIFAFTVLPVTIFFSFFTNILYYFGAIQWIVIKLGSFFRITVGSSMCESMNAAASIFLGQTESPLLIKPYLPIMTNSEIHAIMTAGFATVSGAVLAAYISMGADPALLLTASVMNAPAALAISKLLYPNMRKTRIDENTVASVKSTEVNALHAGCVGVGNAIPLVANIGANLIAFIAFISFFNAVFDWSCQLVSLEEGTCSLEGIFGYIFMPVAWMMGVEWNDCYNVGQLLGLKIIINEFVAYSQLSQFVKDNTISVRSQALATFSLCGFGNISSIGITMGGLGPMAPERKDDMAKIVFRAMIAGSLATYSSACIAGTLLSIPNETQIANSTSNATSTELISSFN